jgi:hypothetical protein
MTEPVRIFDEYNIVLSIRDQHSFDRLLSNLDDFVKANTFVTDEVVMQNKQYSELTTFVETIFQSNKQLMSQYIWQTIIIGFIHLARGTRTY